jgi:hypothetical protein
MCVAAYVVAVTGVSMSVSTAGWLRTGLIGASAVALVLLSANLARRWWRGKCRPRRA